jgi:hypothetical protein
LLDVENSVRHLALREDSLIPLVFWNGSAAVCFGQKRFGVEDELSFTVHSRTPFKEPEKTRLNAEAERGAYRTDGFYARSYRSRG